MEEDTFLFLGVDCSSKVGTFRTDKVCYMDSKDNRRKDTDLNSLEQSDS